MTTTFKPIHLARVRLLVGFEILNASKRMANPMSVEYAVTPPLRRPA